MNVQLFTDNATTTVAAPGLTTGATALNVASGTLFPTIAPGSGDWFIATLQVIVAGLVTAYEIVKVTATAGASWTIVRAQEGTAAQPWVVGNTVALLPTAGGAANFLQPYNVFPIVTLAESAAGFSLADIDTQFEPDNFLRYGIVPNNPAAAASNTAILSQLVNRNVPNGPTRAYSPNTGGAGVAPDTYYFDGFVQVRDFMHLDLRGCIWSCTKTPVNADDNNGFLFVLTGVKIENGSIDCTFNSGGSTTASVAGIMLGARGAPVAGSPLPTVYDALWVHNLGNITLRNLNINVTTGSAGDAYGILALGGLYNVVVESVWIDGGTTCQNGLYYEFGLANNAYIYQCQSSHAWNWQVKNVRITNCVAGGWSMNGAYGITVDGLFVRACGSGIGFGSGESTFFRPWFGVDSWGSTPTNDELAFPNTGTASAGREILLRDIKVADVTGAGISTLGVNATNAWANAGVAPWQPNTLYAAAAVVYNGTYKYTCTTGGVSSNAAGWAGPRGTGSGIVDGAARWTQSAFAGGTGYCGYHTGTTYTVGDSVMNGQYIYQCTTGGSPTATSQGPTGVGTGIADGALVWESIPNAPSAPIPVGGAYQAQSDLLNFVIDGFVIDGGGVGDGIVGGAGILTIKNGKLTNCFNGIAMYIETPQWSIDNVACLNSVSTGLRLGAGFPFWPNGGRAFVGSVRNCTVSGSGGAGIGIGNSAAVLIENNRLGFEVAHDGLVETTQTNAVNVSNANAGSGGVICRNNYCNVAGGGTAYVKIGGSTADGCFVQNKLGPAQNESGAWN